MFHRSSALAVLALVVALSGCSSGKSAAPAQPTTDWNAKAKQLLSGPDWYRHAVFYEVYVRSFQDSNGDGIGDLKGLTSRLDYLKDLGVDAIWLMPIYPSPFKDSGYDVSNYEGINPDYGTMADFDELLKQAHQRGIRILLDLVLNHTSDQHPWFQESRKNKTNPKANWYVWSDTPSSPNIGCGTDNPTFGSSAWTFDPLRNQYYFHRFYAAQPDLNYRDPDVVKATLDVAKFWLDKGVDGFRCDAIALLYESATSCDLIPETKNYIRQLRALLDQYPDRAMVAEPSNDNTSAAYFGNGHDMFHMAFNFAYGYFWQFPFGGGNATAIKAAFQTAQDTYPPGAQDALVIGSHDVARAYTVAQGDETRAQRAALIQMTMPGSPFIYYGEELGLHPGTQKVVDSRDFARTPMLWDSSPEHGFTSGKPWIAFGADADKTNLAVEKADPGSVYNWYKKLLALRRGRAVWGTGQLRLLDTDTSAVLAYVRQDAQLEYLVAVNMTSDSQKATIADAKLPGSGKLVWGAGKLGVNGDAASVEIPGSTGAIFQIK